MNAFSSRRPWLSLLGIYAVLVTLMLTVVGCGARPSSPPTARTTSDFGVLLMAHGGSPEWNDAVLDAVKPLRDRYEIEVALGMADAKSLQDAVSKLEGRGVRRIAVVRLFVSGESFVRETEQILGLAPGAPASESANVEHPIMAAHAAMYGHGDHAKAHPHGDHAEPQAPHAKHASASAGAHAGDAGAHSHADHAEAHPHAKHAGTHPHADHAKAAHPHARHEGHPHAGNDSHRSPSAGGEAHANGHHGHSMAFFRVTTQSSFALSTEGLADAEEMGKVLADRATSLAKAPAQQDVLILAHGPGDDAENTRWLAKLDARASAVRTSAPFRRVQVETLREDWPDKRAAAEQRIREFVQRASADGGQAIVVPFRVQGFGPYANVLKGLEYVSDGKGLIPHAEVTAWIARQIAALEGGSFRAPIAN